MIENYKFNILDDDATDIRSKLGLGIYRDGASRRVFNVAPQYYFKNYLRYEYRGFLLISPYFLYLLGQFHTDSLNRRFEKHYITGTGDTLVSATVSSDGYQFTFDFGETTVNGGIELIG